MYVAAKGGERAIASAHRYLAEARRGDVGVAELGVAQIREQLTVLVDRVMAEGSLYDPDLAALALKQARGDVVEAIFLLRAYRTTLTRFGDAEPVDTARMAIDRRVSATFKDIPGGQILGPTFDYTHRLLDFALAAESEPPVADQTAPLPDGAPHVLSLLNEEGLIAREEPTDARPGDITRQPLTYPADRSTRLQALARGDEGFLLALAYSSQRGYGSTHAFVGELRVGVVTVSFEIPELGLVVEIGEITLTECESVNQFQGSKIEPPQFTRGYGLVFGRGERKALAMALVDRSLRHAELGEEQGPAPVQDVEFVLSHADNVQSMGFLEHIKLPHYVDFQAELEMIRKMRAEIAAREAAE